MKEGKNEIDLITYFSISFRFYSFRCLDWQIVFQKDIRQHGSGNTGTTNTFRVLGKTAGIVVLLMDILKGTLATCLPMIFHLSGINPLWFGVCAILGHTFPILLGSKEEKLLRQVQECF